MDKETLKTFGGWYLPDGEKHLVEHIGLHPREIDGRMSYQYHKLELALGYVTHWRCAVDIGAYVGMWTYHLAKQFDRVESFEPVQEHRTCFVKNIAAPNVRLHPCALGATAGMVHLARPTGCMMSTHITEDGEIPVEMRALDSFALENVDFIKIDTEGYERHVLAGAVNTLARCKPTIIVEQKPGNGSRYGHGDHGALRFLKKRGAKIVAEKAGDYVLVW